MGLSVIPYSHFGEVHSDLILEGSRTKWSQIIHTRSLQKKLEKISEAMYVDSFRT